MTSQDPFLGFGKNLFFIVFNSLKSKVKRYMFDFLCTPEKITGSFVKLAMWFGLIKVKINSQASLFTWIPLWNYSWNIGLAAYFFNNVDFSLHWETWLNKFSLKRSISTLIEMYLQGQWMIVSYIYIYIYMFKFFRSISPWYVWLFVGWSISP